MSRLALFCWGIVTMLLILHPAPLLAQQAKPKNCRMEQQCHWENFKKVCTWVKVCR